MVSTRMLAATTEPVTPAGHELALLATLADSAGSVTVRSIGVLSLLWF